jgi:TolB protein
MSVKNWLILNATAGAVMTLACIFSWPVCAERANLEIFAGNLDSIPIAVLSFSPQNNRKVLRDMPWQIIADDLEFSGRFSVLRLGARDTAMMAGHNTGLCIEGDYLLDTDSLLIECRLTDALTGALITDKRYSGPTADARRMAHRFSGDLCEMLFSERGIFESSIIFIRDNGAVKNICMMDYDGYSLRQLTGMKTINLFPCFTGQASFVWVSYANGNPDLFTCDTGIDKPKLFLGTRHTESSPDYSVIENRLVYSSSADGNLEIYVRDMDGNNQAQLTFNRAVDTSPCWSPEGYHIAFISDRTGHPQIYVMDNEGANVRRLTFINSYQDSPAWSPRGDRIAYTSLSGGTYNIWVIGADGSEARQVTFIAGSNEYPSWSPDGSHIVFHSIKGGHSELYAIRPDGSGLKRLTDLDNARMPDWSDY